MMIKTAATKIISTLITLSITLASVAQTSGIVHRDIAAPENMEWRPDTLSIMIIGDVMMHEKQLHYNHSEFLQEISDELQNADISIVNAEFTLGGEPYSGYPAFSSPDSYAYYLKECGTDVFLTANNHILDKGLKGLERTLEVYGKMDSVHFTGSGRDKLQFESNNPLIINKKGITIALINFTYGTNNRYKSRYPGVFIENKTEIREAIRRAKEKEARYIIALPHWGTEYQLTHNKEQEDLAKFLVNEGVDAIVGSHPHVVQDSARINGVPIYYSVGNAISNMSAKNTRLELAVTLKIPIGGKSRHELKSEHRWMWCSLPGAKTNNYNTIFTDRHSKDEWLGPWDYDNMKITLKRVKEATGLK